MKSVIINTLKMPITALIVITEMQNGLSCYDHRNSVWRGCRFGVAKAQNGQDRNIAHPLS